MNAVQENQTISQDIPEVLEVLSIEKLTSRYSGKNWSVSIFAKGESIASGANLTFIKLSGEKEVKPNRVTGETSKERNQSVLLVVSESGTFSFAQLCKQSDATYRLASGEHAKPAKNLTTTYNKFVAIIRSLVGSTWMMDKPMAYSFDAFKSELPSFGADLLAKLENRPAKTPQAEVLKASRVVKEKPAVIPAEVL